VICHTNSNRTHLAALELKHARQAAWARQPAQSFAARRACCIGEPGQLREPSRVAGHCGEALAQPLVKARQQTALSGQNKPKATTKQKLSYKNKKPTTRNAKLCTRAENAHRTWP
jgi:hypothetical protein